MQIAGDPFALIFPDSDLREDLFPLQFHIAPVVADNGCKEINDDYRDNQRDE